LLKLVINMRLTDLKDFSKHARQNGQSKVGVEGKIPLLGFWSGLLARELLRKKSAKNKKIA